MNSQKNQIYGRSGRGFRYIFTEEKYHESKHLTPQQRLEWLEEFAEFMYYAMPPESKAIAEKLKSGSGK